MMVEIGHFRPGVEDPHQVLPVDVQGHVHDRHGVSRLRKNPAKQLNVAFHPRDEGARRRVRQPPLLQSAEAVGIAVEDVVSGHACSKGFRSPPAGHP